MQVRLRSVIVVLGLMVGCAGSGDTTGYRLGGWDMASHQVPTGLQDRYPDFFSIVLDPNSGADPNLLRIRDDLERQPVTSVNYDALNATAIGYFTMNQRAESERGGPSYLGNSFSAAKLIAVPWRAYGVTDDGALREAILDFFADIAGGEKNASARTASRLARVVASLTKKERDPKRLQRIEEIVDRLAAQIPPS